MNLLSFFICFVFLFLFLFLFLFIFIMFMFMPVSLPLSLCLLLAYRRCFPWYANELNYLFYHKWFCLSNLEIASSSVNQPQAEASRTFSQLPTPSPAPIPIFKFSVSLYRSLSAAISFHSMPWHGISSLVCFMLYPLEFFLQLLGSRASSYSCCCSSCPSSPPLSCLWPPLFKELRETSPTHSQAVASFGAILALKSLTVHVKFLVFLYIIAVAGSLSLLSL